MPATRTPKKKRRPAASPTETERLREAFWLLSNPIRLNVLLLMAVRPYRVKDLCEATGALQSNLSNHLVRLKRAGIIEWTDGAKASSYGLTAKGKAIVEAVRLVADGE